MCPNPFRMIIWIFGILIGFRLFLISPVAFSIFIVVCILLWIFTPRYYVFCGIPQIAESRYSEWMHRNDPVRIAEDAESQKKIQEVLDEMKEHGIINRDIDVKILHDYKR